MSTKKLSLRDYMTQITDDHSNYKGSGLPKFQKFNGKIFEGYQTTNDPHWISNLTELEHITYELYDEPLNLNSIIKLYGEDNILIPESIIIQLSVSELDEIKEYNRHRNIWCSKRTPHQFDVLYEDIKQHGIINPGRVRLTRQDNNIIAILGEGNHRLSIAKQLKLKYMPITIRYSEFHK